MEKIVFLSHTPRNSIFKVGSFHLSNVLASRNFLVCYISAPLTLIHFFQFFIQKEKRKEILNRLKYIKIKQDSSGVYNHTPIFLFPLYPNKLGSFLYHKCNLNLNFTAYQLRKKEFRNVDRIFLDDLKLNKILPVFNFKKFIYRATDIYKSMNNDAVIFEEIEKKIILNADYIVVTSEPLRKIFKEEYNREALVLINGVNFSHFNEPKNKPEIFTKINVPSFIYVGSFDFRFDFEILDFFSTQTDIALILIGPSFDKGKLPTSNNIIYLGEINYSEIPAYLQHASAGILPLKVIEANHGRSPMKLYEFAAAGLPILSPKLREVERRNHNFVYIYDSVESLRKQMNKLFVETIQEAKKYSWDSITNRILQYTQF